MKRLLILLCVVAVHLAPGLPAHAAQPNVLFLFADDHAYEAVRAFGHTDIDTPNLDRLAARGTAFTRAPFAWQAASCSSAAIYLQDEMGDNLDLKNSFAE